MSGRRSGGGGDVAVEERKERGELEPLKGKEKDEELNAPASSRTARKDSWT